MNIIICFLFVLKKPDLNPIKQTVITINERKAAKLFDLNKP